MADHVAFQWSSDERAQIDALLNQLIPASADGKVPAAGTLGVGDFIATKLPGDRALQETFRNGLERAAEIGASDADAVARIETELPTFFQALRRLTYMGYYSRPDIRALFGLSAKPVHPDGYEVPVEPEALMADLTAPVRRRGQCYRDA